MSIHRIKYFIQVAEVLNFSQAAEQMHISRQALSKQVRLLERELGAELLERSTTQLTLTEVGTKVYHTFRPLMREMERGYDEVRDFIRNKKETLRVGCFSGLSYQRVLAPLLQWFTGKAPQLRVELMSLESIESVQQMLEEDRIDLAVYPRLGPYEWENKTCLCLKRVPAQIVVSENHPWYGLEQITAKDVTQGSLLWVRESRPRADDHVFLPQLRTAERIPVHSFDTYMALLWQGRAFGIVDNTYSRREGNYKLFPLPEELTVDALIVAAYKRLHPLRRLLETMTKMDLDP